jgi:ABC-type branched-subunit amino acid transport system substrate-binding protein
MKNLVLALGLSFLFTACTVSTKRSDYGNPYSPNARRANPQTLPPKRPVNPPGLESSSTSVVVTQQAQQVPMNVPDWRALNPDQLRAALQDPQYVSQRVEILFRLGEQEMARRNTDMALNYFNQVLDQGSGTIWAQQAKNNLDLLRSLEKVSATTIGVILPLTGRNAAIGQRMLKTIEMGLGLHYGKSNFQLAVIDTQGNPDKARRGVERLVREDNVVAVLGALSSREAESAALMADELGVPLITLSQRSGLTDVSPYVYRNSLTPEMQIYHLVQTAMTQYGMKKFAILYPNDAYGVESANIFWDQVEARGGEITAAQIYDPNSTDFKVVCEKLSGKFYIEARLEEYKAKQKEFSQKARKRSSRENISAEDILDPIVNYDAIFIPDSAKNMGQISAFLSYVGVKDVHLLGTNLWNTPGLARRAGHFQNSLLFVDGFIQDSTAAKNSRFVAEFKSLFHDDPSIMEIQAYESALILRGIIMKGSDNRREVASALNQLENFPGAVGPLSMSNSREVIRPLYSLTLRKGEIIPLDIRE